MPRKIETKRGKNMRKLIALALCAVAALSLAACGEKKEEPAVTGNIQIANPFVDYDSLEEAAKAAGFGMDAPARVEGFDETLIQLMSGKMLQVIYSSGDDRLLVRKAAGSDDISGDYNSYSREQTLTLDGRTVTLRGDGDTVSVATWTDGGYTYAVDADTPMSVEVITALIAQIA